MRRRQTPLQPTRLKIIYIEVPWHEMLGGRLPFRRSLIGLPLAAMQAYQAFGEERLVAAARALVSGEDWSEYGDVMDAMAAVVGLLWMHPDWEVETAAPRNETGLAAYGRAVLDELVAAGFEEIDLYRLMEMPHALLEVPIRRAEVEAAQDFLEPPTGQDQGESGSTSSGVNDSGDVSPAG